MRKVFGALLVLLGLVSGCVEENFVGVDGRTNRIVHGIKFNELDRDQSGFPRLRFTLTNSTQYPLCVSIFTRSQQFGAFDLFLSDDTSYLDAASSYLWVPEINQPIKDDFESSGNTLQIPAGGKSEIYRTLTTAVYESEAGVNMIAGTKFDGAFEGRLDLLAELKVVLYRCDIDNPNQRAELGNYLFTSDRVGPFRISIPSE